VTPSDVPPVEWEEPLPTLTGRAWAFGIVLTLTDVLPPRYADLAPRDARRYVLGDVDPDWAARVRDGDVVAVEEMHGVAAGGVALAALRHTGIAALVARRYAEGLEAAALAAGIVPVTLDAPAFIHTGDRVRLDLEAAKIVNLSSGDRAAIRNLDEARRAAVRTMLRAHAGA
jgi:3-isopropylmalate dehydratase small subunit